MIKTASMEQPDAENPADNAADRALAYLIRRTRRIAAALLVTAIASGVVLSIIG